MLDSLRCRYQSRIFNFRIGFFFNHFSPFRHNTFHTLAFGSASGLFVARQNLLQPLGVLFGLFKMLLKSARKFFVTGCLCHFRQCFYELLLCAEKILQLMNIKIFKSIKFHRTRVRLETSGRIQLSAFKTS